MDCNPENFIQNSHTVDLFLVVCFLSKARHKAGVYLRQAVPRNARNCSILPWNFSYRPQEFVLSSLNKKYPPGLKSRRSMRSFSCEFREQAWCRAVHSLCPIHIQTALVDGFFLVCVCVCVCVCILCVFSNGLGQFLLLIYQLTLIYSNFDKSNTNWEVKGCLSN